MSVADEPLLAAGEIQGHILPGFGNQPTCLVGIRRRETTADADAALRRFLRELAPSITTLEQSFARREERRAIARACGIRPCSPDVFLSVALASGALPPLLLPTDRIREAAFLRGMAGANLGHELDATGRPLSWVVGGSPETTPEALLIVGCDDAAVLAVAVEGFLAGLPAELAVVYRETGAPLAGEKEHFGFRDGISQPGVRGRVDADQPLTRRYFDAEDPRAAYEARPGQGLIWPGQFVFGYPTQVDLDPVAAGPLAKPPHPWMRNGSFLAFQRLRQDVPAFQEFVRQEALRVSTELGREVSAGEFAAWLVGRWPDGTPLMRSPEGPDPQIVDDSMAINFFGYAAAESPARVRDAEGPDAEARVVPGSPEDNGGLRCPHFAHIRKVNARDKGTDLGASTRFRILRRGIPFGPPFEEGEAGCFDRGLLFLSYQRSLHPQFLTLFATWMNQDDAPEGFGHDLLAGNHLPERRAERFFADGSRCTLKAPGRNPWIVSTGGAFFFTPAISVLAQLP